MQRSGSYVDDYLSGSAFDRTSGAISITEQLIRRLRVAVFNGDLRPGQKLRESELCQSYDVSRATLREALRLLESERLVELIPNRGPFVAKLGITEIEEIHDVWAMLTGEAVYRFAERCKPADLAELEKCIDQLQAAVDNNDPVMQISATNRFFAYVSDKAANRILYEITAGVVSRLMFLRAQSLLNHQWGRLYVEEIEDIVEAMRLRSPEDARVATKRHIASACAAAKQSSLIPDQKPLAKARRTMVKEPAPPVVSVAKQRAVRRSVKA